VSAALSAVKDMVKVPWQISQSVASSLTPSASPSPVESGGSAAREDLVIVPEVTEEAAAPQVIEPVTSESGSMITQMVARKATEDTSESADATAGESPEEVDVEQEHEPAVSDTSKTTKKVKADEATPTPKRILLRKHFDVALLEIRPSSTEEGTLPELRKVCGI
jgi:hypothetical protein